MASHTASAVHTNTAVFSWTRALEAWIDGAAVCRYLNSWGFSQETLDELHREHEVNRRLETAKAKSSFLRAMAPVPAAGSDRAL